MKVRSKVMEQEVMEVKCGLCNGFVSESLTPSRSSFLYHHHLVSCFALINILSSC